MALIRTEHWATREFNQFLLDHVDDTFAWGLRDCCLMPADAIKAFTGTDIADGFRGKYNDQTTAFEAIKMVAGGTTVGDAAAYCAAKHGLTEWQSPLFAQRGDLGVVRDDDQLIAGIVHLNGRHVVCMGPTGLKRLPMSTVTRAWKV